MKNILLRLALVLTYIVFLVITAFWLICTIIPVLIFIGLYWIVKGKSGKEFIALVLAPMVVPFLFEDKLKEKEIIK